MSVQMNYPMVQYLRHALQNDTSVIQELDKLLGLASSTNNTIAHMKDGQTIIRVETQKGILNNLSVT